VTLALEVAVKPSPAPHTIQTALNWLRRCVRPTVLRLAAKGKLPEVLDSLGILEYTPVSEDFLAGVEAKVEPEAQYVTKEALASALEDVSITQNVLEGFEAIVRKVWFG